MIEYPNLNTSTSIIDRGTYANIWLWRIARVSYFQIVERPIFSTKSSESFSVKINFVLCHEFYLLKLWKPFFQNMCRLGSCTILTQLYEHSCIKTKSAWIFANTYFRETLNVHCSRAPRKRADTREKHDPRTHGIGAIRTWHQVHLNNQKINSRRYQYRYFQYI